MSNGIQEPFHNAEIPVFLSYARKDEELLQFMQPFKDLLAFFVEAKTGRKINAFVDTESIGWGDRWADEITKSVLQATVFIPMLSANYLASDHCRKEFSQFYKTASELGVNELVLPVMVLDSPMLLNESSKDDIVEKVLSHQYERIDEAVLTSAGSPEWKQTMSNLADRFNSAYDKAESKIAKLDPETSRKENTSMSGKDPMVDVDDDMPGLAEIVFEMDQQFTDLTAIVGELKPAMEAIARAQEESAPPSQDNMTPKALQQWSFRAAHGFKDPALKIEKVGIETLNKVQELDKSFFELKRISDDVEELRDGYQQLIQATGDLSMVRNQLAGLLQSLKVAENISAAVRRSLKPMRNGIVLFQDALSIMDSWRSSEPGN